VSNKEDKYTTWERLNRPYPFKVEKSIVQAKSRALSAHWTIEIPHEAEHEYSRSAEEEIAKIFQEEFDRAVLEEIKKQ
jgi:hypothetical protein